jgi:hypothetical protein
VLRDGETLEDLFGILPVAKNTTRSSGSRSSADEADGSSSSSVPAAGRDGDGDPDASYRSLCASIVDGGAANDARTWLAVIDRARRARAGAAMADADADAADPPTTAESAAEESGKENRPDRLVLRRGT